MDEGIVFEAVCRWVNHDINKRESLFPVLMKSVRLQLISTENLAKNISPKVCICFSFLTLNVFIKRKRWNCLKFPNILFLTSHWLENSLNAVIWLSKLSNTMPMLVE